MSAIVRDARTDELSRFLPLVIRGWMEYAEALGPENWSVMCASMSRFDPARDGGRVFVAEVDGELAGCVIYYRPGASDGVIFPREWASIRLLTVLPEARGLGLGRALMERCVEAARADRAGTLGLHTEERMTVARGLYVRMGFRPDADLKPKYGMPRWRFAMHFDDDGGIADHAIIRSSEQSDLEE
jgi:GNAT superfamily N-acetyltransferase